MMCLLHNMLLLMIQNKVTKKASAGSTWIRGLSIALIVAGAVAIKIS